MNGASVTPTPGEVESQGFSSNGIDLVLQEYYGLGTRRFISLVPSQIGNHP